MKQDDMLEKEQDDLLKDWPYIRQHVLSSMDPALIEEHAHTLLCRALNIGRVVAFVSSGVSACYGRMSWRELVDALKNEALRKLSDLQPKGPTQKLKQLLEELSKKTDTSDRLTILLQLCVTLGDASIRELGDQKGFNARKRASALLKSETWSIAEAVGAEADETEADETEAAQAHSGKGNHNKLAPRCFQVDALLNLAGRVSSQNRNHLATVISHLHDMKGREIKHLLPTHRFLAKALLKCTPVKGKLDWLAYVKSELDVKAATASPELPQELDPLRTLARDLNIRRYLTTNYDGDIEALFERLGYSVERPSTEANSNSKTTARVDPLGALSKDFVYSTDRAADLVNFASYEEGGPLQLVHLHGRASTTAESNLVLTEDDYQRLYLSDADSRDMVDASLSLTFAANPILFVGSGMSEDDILRPLRRFMSERKRHDDRVAIALMPMLNDHASSVEDRINYLARYGVYSIFYGRATLPNKPGVSTPNEQPHWLSDVCELIKHIKRCLDGTLSPFDLEASIKTKPALFDPLDAYTLSLPLKVEGIETTSNAFALSFEVKLLNACINFAMNKPSDTDVIEAYKIIVDGVSGAIQAKLFNAKLKALKMRWSDWIRDWSKLPEPRPVGFERQDTGGDHIPPIEHLRHNIKLAERPDKELAACSDKSTSYRRFFKKGGAQTFDALANALSHDAQHRSADPNSVGRRLFLLVSRRGAGKGHFFSSLQTEARLQQLIAKSWGGRTAPKYVRAGFYNLSFSLEVSSAFDGITQLLEDSLEGVFPKEGVPDEILHKRQQSMKAAKTDQASELGSRRIDRLDHILDRYERLAVDYRAGAQSHCPARILIAINAVEILFDDKGHPKNGQLARLFNLLVGNHFRHAPIDLLLVCGEGALPAHFKLPHADDVFERLSEELGGDIRFVERVDQPLTIITRDDISRTARDEILVRVTSTKLNASFRHDRALRSDCSHQQWMVLHYLRPASMSLLACAYFPTLSAACMAQMREPGTSHPIAQLKHFESVKLVEALMDLYQPPAEANESAQTIADFRNSMPILAAGWLDEQKREPSRVKELARLFTPDGHPLELEKMTPADLDRLQRPLDDKDKEQVSSAVKFCGRMRQLAKVLDYGRFATTLLLAAAEERMLTAIDSARDDEEEVRSAIKLAALDWIDEVERKIRARNERSRSEVVVESALEAFSDLHTPKVKLPGWVENKSPLHDLQKNAPRILDRLLKQILWHLAVIGQPVEARVLACCPEIEKLTKEIKKPYEEEAARAARVTQVVADAMKLLVFRCLVFEIDNRGLSDPPVRYALHRSVQRFLFRKMNAPLTEYARIDQFTMTMYATQPSELPRPEPEMHRKVTEATAALMQYPIVADERGKPIRNGAQIDKEIVGERLRAAYGFFRSIYSIAVVSRLADYDAGFDEREHGRFEEHRLQIRWLLKMATTFSRPGNGRNPLYQEEIAWLYNECALLSFIQGKLNDALGLFRQALRAAEVLESKDSIGPLRTRINLNLAIVEIERGSFVTAEALLGPIIKLSHEHPVARLVAQGYQGLIEQLRGDKERAAATLERAFLTLAELGRWRGAAIFGRHYGDLLRSRGPGHFDRANEVLQQSLNFAERGGQEDVRQLVRLSLARFQSRVHSEPSSRLRGVAADLDSIERYGRQMGMPRILCEVAAFRAQMLLNVGETRLASTFAARSLEIATINGMTLRRAAAMVLLAQTYMNREDGYRCEPILTRALDIARNIQYYNLIQNADLLLSTLGRRSTVSSH